MLHTSTRRSRGCTCFSLCSACYVACFIAALVLVGPARSASSPRYPIVLVPGLAGSVLDAKIDRTTTAAWYCSRKADWRVVYLSFREVLSPLCLCDELVISYDEEIDRYHNQQGVDVRPHDFGGLDGVSALDPAYPSITATYAPLIKALEKAGYKNGVNLWGAPYDWRLSADGLENVGFGDDLKTLLENAYQTAGDTKVVIIAHSMGNLVVHHFLKSWGDEWTRKHLHSFISVSGPWSGAPAALKGPISGDNFDLPIPHDLLHTAQRSVPSGPWLFPLPSHWGEDEVLVRSRKAAYTAHELMELMQKSGLDMLAKVYPKLRNMREKQLEDDALPIPLLCVYGDGVDTDVSYKYDVDSLTSSSLPEPKTLKSDAGDGTVPRRSLELCTTMGTRNMTDTIVVHKASHLGVLSSDALINLIHRRVDLTTDASTMIEAASLAAQNICSQRKSLISRVQEAIMARSLSPLLKYEPPLHCMRGDYTVIRTS